MMHNACIADLAEVRCEALCAGFRNTLAILAKLVYDSPWQDECRVTLADELDKLIQ